MNFCSKQLLNESIFDWHVISEEKKVAEVATGGVLLKKEFLEISPNLQENACAIVSFLIKLQASVLQLYLKRNSGTGFFLWILRNLWEHFFNSAPPRHCIYSSYPFNIVRGMLICFRWKTMFIFIIWVRTTSNCIYTRSFKQELFAVSVG